MTNRRAIRNHQILIVGLSRLSTAIANRPARHTFRHIMFRVTSRRLVTQLRTIMITSRHLRTIQNITNRNSQIHARTRRLNGLHTSIRTILQLRALTRLRQVTTVSRLSVTLMFLSRHTQRTSRVTILRVSQTELSNVAINRDRPRIFVTNATNIVKRKLLDQFDNRIQIYRI